MPMTQIAFDFQMLWPICAVVALTFVAGGRLLTLRIRALRSRAVGMAFYRSYRAGEEPEPLAVASRHYSNLYETPILFYLGCLIAGLLGPASTLALAAAWGFVVLRYAQSAIHLTSNKVRQRAYTFFVSVFALLVLWASNIMSLLDRAT